MSNHLNEKKKRYAKPVQKKAYLKNARKAGLDSPEPREQFLCVQYDHTKMPHTQNEKNTNAQNP